MHSTVKIIHGFMVEVYPLGQFSLAFSHNSVSSECEQYYYLLLARMDVDVGEPLCKIENTYNMLNYTSGEKSKKCFLPFLRNV